MLGIGFTRTLKSKLILYFLAITIIPSVAISYFFFRTSQQTLEKNMVDTSVSNLAYTVTLMDKQLNNAAHLSDWLFMNKNLDVVLTKEYPGPELGYDKDIETFLELKDYQLRYNVAVGTYVYSVVINGKNGMDLRAGHPEGTQIDIDALKQTEWFQYGMSLQGKKSWYGIAPNPAAVKYEKYILPLVRPVFHSTTNQEIGWHMIGLKVSLIADLFKGLEARADETLMVIDPRRYAVYHSDPALVGQYLGELDYVREVMDQGALQGDLRARIDQEQRHITFARSDTTGWSIIKVLSSAELNTQRRMLIKITLAISFASFVFVSFLTVYLSTNLTRPLTRILRRTREIASGNFERDPSIEGEDELGTLGRAVNLMADNIRDLLNTIIANEQEKRRLELEVLQNQVNPHFLHNTLNSLKVMASLQKAEGIKQMVTALGRLLMYISKNTAETITLEEEISLLNDYIYIQNMRYQGRIQLNYKLDDEKHLNCKIIKFTLQPIVENAIFHGIEPKRDAGRIDISVSERDGRLVICVRDDGVGMTPEEIESALAPSQSAKTRGLSGIGIRNVNERIKLTYGQEYGLTIKSVVGEYTEVYLEIPLEASLVESGSPSGFIAAALDRGDDALTD
ncbi:MAG: sensor histidine kinase [Firmicutes bacterium]|nr:sensor histidine kinase [Bacillota bacterium]